MVSDSTEMEQIKQPGIDENIDVSLMKKIGELAAETENIVENRTEIGMQTRTRNMTEVKLNK